MIAPIDTRTLRDVAGHFATGVVVVTTRDAQSRYYGLTMNAVTCLSLDPPLYLICVANSSNTLEPLRSSEVFAVNILGEGQQELAQWFAGKNPEKFVDVPYHFGRLDIPLLDGAVAMIECQLEALYPGGDHVIAVGSVAELHVHGGHPLVFHRGRYLIVPP